MRRNNNREGFSTAKGSTGSRGSTVLGTPAITSCGLFHQQVSRSSSRSEPLPPPTPGQAVGRALEDSGDQHSNALLERYTSAAKDGVIDMLTGKASKLGITMERTLLAKKEVEDRVERLQGLLDGESARRKDLEHRLEQQQEETEVTGRDIESLRWEVGDLQGNLRGAEERSKAWVQEEAERRLLAEEALSREHVVAVEYLEGVYQEGDGPVIGKEGGTVADTLVRELLALGDELRIRNEERRAQLEMIAQAFTDLKAERERRGGVQEELTFTQERVEVARNKARQLSSQLEVEAGENEALRARVRVLEEGNEMRVKVFQERKVKAQERKRGDTRNVMAESKMKDDRIKNLESTLMQERARLEGELQSARSGYEDAAKESRRKAARIQRRCLELEYRLATQSNGPEKNNLSDEADNNTRTASSSGWRNTALQSFELRSGVSRRGSGGGAESVCSENLISTLVSTAGLISAASMLPWRRGASSSATPSTAGSAAQVAGALVNVADTAVQSGGERRRSADRLPDPARNNQSAPAWMRSDLAVDKVDMR